MKHLLNYGMGVDSTAILLRWILDSASRPFPLKDLIVVSAQTGNEYGSTKTLVETYILPLMRSYGIRYVQVAKAGHSIRDGYTILSDTRSPDICHTEGDYTLGHAMRIAGTQPQRAGAHTCAMRWKGEVLDAWLKDTCSGEAIGPYLGYAKGEERRADKCSDYECMGSEFLFPLLDWGWERQDCIDYIQAHLGIEWQKSCCVYCPFQNAKAAAERWEAEPEAGIYALMMESAALALNPRQNLFGTTSAFDVASDRLKRLLLDRLDQTPWALYRVERIYRGRMCDRRVEKVSGEITRLDAEAKVSQIAKNLGLTIEASDQRFTRAYSHHRNDGELSCEAFWVAAPAFIRSKVRNAKSFQNYWEQATGHVNQLSII